MTIAPQPHARNARSLPSALFRMPEFDVVTEHRPVGEMLRDSLEDAEAQLRLEQRRARRAERRAQDLSRAVRNWQELLEDYESATTSTAEHRRN